MSIADKLTAVAENVPKVFAAGKRAGYDEGFAAGTATSGGDNYYDTFWDAYQQNGNRTDYSTAFGGQGWTADNFKPKHNLMVTNAYMMFRNSTLNIDLPKHLESLGVSLDFSQAQNLQYCFNGSQLTRVGVFDTSSCTNGVTMDSTFNNCTKLVTIDKIILKTGPDGQFANTFRSCSKLKNVTFDGVIERNGFDMQWSKNLSKASIESIINALSDTTSGLTVTLSYSAVLYAVYRANNPNPDPNEIPFLPVFPDEWWNPLIATKPNWTINLV